MEIIYRLYLNKNNKETEILKSKMVPDLWQLVDVEYSAIIGPLLLTENDKKIADVNQIIDFLINKSGRSASFFQQVKSVQQVAKKQVNALIKGEKILVEKQVIEERKSICLKCPKKISFLGADKCLVCGCFLRAKIQLISENCPVGKW